MKDNLKLVAWLAGAALLVALEVSASVQAFWQIEEAAADRAQTHGTIKKADDLLSALKDAETGQRGYLITGDESFLEPYLGVRDGILDNLAALRQRPMIAAHRQHLDAQVPLVTAKLAHMSKLIELRRNHDMASVSTLANGQGKRLMDAIRSEMKSFIQLEEGALAEDENSFQSYMRQMFIYIVATSLIVFLLALTFSYIIYRNQQQRLKDFAYLEAQKLIEVQKEANAHLRRANLSLQVSEEKLAVTLNSIGDAVIATDAEARVTLLNPCAENLTGWPQADALGRPVEDIFHIINQETREPATIPIKETLAHATIHGLANHTILIARDGGECAIADSCAPICDHDGLPIGAVLVFRDVTKEYAAQKTLSDHQFYTRSLIESNIDALVTTDRFGTITDVNRQMETLTGTAREELVGTPFKHFFTDPARAQAGVDRVVAEKTLIDCELTASARETAVSFNATTFYDRDGRLQGVIAAARDVTERKRLDQALLDKNAELETAKSAAEKANLAKSEFLSSMSHELRSPLTAILGFAQLMESEPPPLTPTQKESVEQILHAGWLLLTLIEEVLDLAKIESGHVSLSMEPVSLAEIILECQGMIAPQAQQRGIRMTFPKFDSPFFVLADRTRVKQVLVNLLSNAIKYNTKQGSVDVTCALENPGHVRISVRDTGAGLHPEQLSQLFQEFNRLGQETGTEVGTGIGLVMARRLVELMSGDIGVESAVGVGSVFWFELAPVAAPAFSAEDAETATLGLLPALDLPRKRIVLYVEDNPANLKLVERIIGSHPDITL
ncbi:MAG: CHASE3 domain-containing protein, partial [Rhodospirillaceae bacterium]